MYTIRNVFVKISHILQENNIFNKVASISSETCDIFKNTYFEEHLIFWTLVQSQQ